MENRPPYRSARTLCMVAVGFFGLVLLLGLVRLWSQYSQLQLLERLLAHQPVTQAEAVANDGRQRLTVLLFVVVYLTGIILFFVWLARANRNLRALGARELKFTPGWSVGWFFVPFANFVMPYQVMSEVWRASDPERDELDSGSWQWAKTSPLVLIWWIVWLIGNLGSQILSRSIPAHPTVPQLINHTKEGFVSPFLTILSSALTLVIILAVTRKQEKLSERLQSA